MARSPSSSRASEPAAACPALRYLKEMNPEIKVIGARPDGSVLSGGTPKPWKVEGIGEDFVPRRSTANWWTSGSAWRRGSISNSTNAGPPRRHVVRRFHRNERRRRARYAQRLGPEHLVITLGCDTGRNYLSKFFDDAWLADNKLTSVQATAHSIGDLLRKRGPRQLVKITPDTTAAQAIDLMEATGISQLPVITADGKPVGSVQEVTLARVLHDQKDPNAVKIGDVMARPLPTVDINTHLDEPYRLLLAGYTGVLATQQHQVVDIVTRIDHTLLGLDAEEVRGLCRC